MVTGPIQQPSMVPAGIRLPAARQPRATLLDDTRALTRALATPIGDPHWRECLHVGLAALRQSFAEHVQATEGPGGRYADLLAHAPRLDRGVRLLVREHATVAAALGAFQQTLEWPAASVDDLRIRAGHLLRVLARHRQRGADLIWQAYQTDLGGET